MAATGRFSSELQEDRERWLSVFSESYDMSMSMQDLQELKPPFVLSIYLQFVKSTLNASLDNMKMVRRLLAHPSLGHLFQYLPLSLYAF